MMVLDIDRKTAEGCIEKLSKGMGESEFAVMESSAVSRYRFAGEYYLASWISDWNTSLRDAWRFSTSCR